ncbi:hypothetical protein CSKR_114079, partial [Clonorchis sinensis]
LVVVVLHTRTRKLHCQFGHVLELKFLKLSLMHGQLHTNLRCVPLCDVCLRKINKTNIHGCIIFPTVEPSAYVQNVLHVANMTRYIFRLNRKNLDTLNPDCMCIAVLRIHELVKFDKPKFLMYAQYKADICTPHRYKPQIRWSFLIVTKA